MRTISHTTRQSNVVWWHFLYVYTWRLLNLTTASFPYINTHVCIHSYNEVYDSINTYGYADSPFSQTVMQLTTDRWVIIWWRFRLVSQGRFSLSRKQHQSEYIFSSFFVSNYLPCNRTVLQQSSLLLLQILSRALVLTNTPIFILIQKKLARHFLVKFYFSIFSKYLSSLNIRYFSAYLLYNC